MESADVPAVQERSQPSHVLLRSDSKDTVEYRQLLDQIAILPTQCPLCTANLIYAREETIAVGICQDCQGYLVRASPMTSQPKAAKYQEYQLGLPSLDLVFNADTFETKLRLCLRVLDELKTILDYAKDGIFSTSRVRRFLDEASEKCRSHWDIIIRAGLADHIDRENYKLDGSN